jgi:uncharacterized membrane protein YeiH
MKGSILVELQETVVFIMEILGTIAFAASGAMVGIGKKMDIFGICVLGVITAVGGGIIRDIILGIIPPGVFTNPIYVLVATIVSVFMFVMLYINRGQTHNHIKLVYDIVMFIMDTIGLGVFTVVGVHTGMVNGYSDKGFLLIFLGTITGVGGGMLRDVLAGIPPMIFVKHIYACASIAGAFICVVLNRFTGELTSMLAGFGAVVLIRFLAAHYRWNLPRIKTEMDINS